MSCFRLVTLAFLLVLATSVSADESAPEWSKKTFNAPPDRVFAAALKSITAQHHEIKTKDEATMLITFHVGMTAWSWGYNMSLKVVPGANNGSDVSIEIARSGGKTVSWGSGKKEVLKIFNGIDKELAAAPPGEKK